MPPQTTVSPISNANYPIVGRWLILKFFSSIILGLFLGFLFGFFAFVQSTTTTNNGATLAGTLGWSGGQVIFWVVLFILFCTAINFIWSILWRSTFSFECGSDYITKREGVVSRSEKHVPYRTVQDVLVSQSFFGRLLGLATVTVQNAAQGMGTGNISIPGQPLAKANELSTLIRQIVLSKNSTQTGL